MQCNKNHFPQSGITPFHQLREGVGRESIFSSSAGHFIFKSLTPTSPLACQDLSEYQFPNNSSSVRLDKPGMLNGKKNRNGDADVKVVVGGGRESQTTRKTIQYGNLYLSVWSLLYRGKGTQKKRSGKIEKAKAHHNKNRHSLCLVDVHCGKLFCW